MDRLRADVATGQRPLRITTHAQVEAFKDGLLLAELRYTFEHGEVIEIYPDDNRAYCTPDCPNIICPFTLL